VFTNIYPRDTNSATWVRSIISTSPQNNNTYLFTELVNKAANPYTRLVKVREINAQAAELNSNNNALCQSEIVDGKVKLCPRGCTNCECTSCISGFVYDSSSKSCFACAPGCIECDSTVLTKCTYCYPGYFKNSTNNCQPCQAPCLTCSVSATSCSKCPPGQYYSTGLTQCDNCPRNCFNCTNGSACSTCQPGFVLNPNNNVCRKCSIKCSSCNPSDITKCTSCAKGLQLLNGDCVPCSANCLSCSSGQCAECSTGYHVNSNGSCVLDCKIPCVTCA
jgi:proprotein convertase subtilisin/kexin type 5